MRFGPLIAVLVTLLSTRAALANGRFPNATQLVAAPGDPDRFAIRATYGLLQTFDHGKTWSWLCEDAVGYRGTFDPAITLTADGTLLAGLPDGLSATRDRGCSWTRALGPSLVVDLARTVTAPERVAALAVAGEAGTDTVLSTTTDAGLTWSTVSTLVGLRGETVDFAPSDGMRVYVSGTKSGRGAFFRSDDGGATFGEHEVDLFGGQAPYIAAVDPRDPNIVYVRVNAAVADGAVQTDALLVTRDGGATFVRVPTPVRQLLGVALSADGTQLAVGGPDDGVFVASTSDYAFARRAQLRVRCLTWTSDALYACSSRDADGFAVGRSVDGGSTFTQFFDVPQLTHLVCPEPATINATCREAWTAVSSMIGEDPNAFVPDAGRPSAQPPAAPDTEPGCGRCHYGRGGGAPTLAIMLVVMAWRSSRRSPSGGGRARGR